MQFRKQIQAWKCANRKWNLFGKEKGYGWQRVFRSHAKALANFPDAVKAVLFKLEGLCLCCEVYRADRKMNMPESSSFAFPKLDGSNYTSWKGDMKATDDENSKENKRPRIKMDPRLKSIWEKTAKDGTQ
ncbi:hypothetical protein AVEN_12159-1 [Araneus ventricosus]|uniref:DUF4219 domain-containing protein n=1 Tax=Araneus ventricosus TaxID=182803 RepID=A0A4Y2W3P6_ARAVE|nr:hypothetical protein AVEN_12159-1 [Araneus ventricosus]